MTERPIEIKTNQRSVEPFWSKLPFFFAFPFRPAPLIFLACLVAASALAGLVLGPFGLVFRGILIYLGLRYGFNVLDLFRKGRFEGESPDHPLWSSDTRPAKLGLVIALFVGLGAAIGNFAVASRVDGHAPTQRLLLEAYKREHARELEAQRRSFDERRDQLRAALREATVPNAEERAAEEAADSEMRAAASRWRAERRGEIAAEIEALDKEEAAQGEYGRPREEILREAKVEFASAMWFALLPGWFWPLMVLLSFLLPAATLVIAIDDEFFRALNPTWVPYFLKAMGGAYFVLWAFFLAIVFARQAVLGLGADWPAFLRLPVEMGLGGYLAMVMCAFLGYAIYQYHQELHLDVDVDFDTHRHAGGAAAIARAGSAHKAIEQADPQSPLGRRVQQLSAAGDIRTAISLVQDELRYERLDPELNLQLHALYLRAGDRQVTLAHGQTLLKALVRAGQTKPAMAALRKLVAIDSQYKVEDAAACAALAPLAKAQGEHELAARLAARAPQGPGAA